MHWLACTQDPASVRVVWSKISIAVLVPVTLAFAVAVRIAFSPGTMKVFMALRSRRCADPSGRRVATGTLGGTRGSPIELPRVAASTGPAMGSKTSVHAAGLLSPGLLAADVQGALPSGVEATPGTAVPTPSLMLHAAPSPDAVHCSAPAGTLTRASFAGAVWAHPSWVSGTPSSPTAQTVATWLTAWATIRLDGVTAARATTLRWFETTKNASARCVLGRDMKTDTSCCGKCTNPPRGAAQPETARLTRESTGGLATGLPRLG